MKVKNLETPALVIDRQEMEKNLQRLKELLAYLSERGIESREVSGGSTGTVALKTKSTVYTEIQPGSFIFLDMAYQGMHTVFQNSLFVMATVVSAGPNHFVLDAGIKSICPDQGNPGLVGHSYESINLSEEHTAFWRFTESIPSKSAIWCR